MKRSGVWRDRDLIAVAVSASLGAWVARPVSLVLGVSALAAGWWCRRPLVLCLALVLLGSSLGARAWSGVAAPSAGAYQGPAVVRDDPVRRGPVVRTTLEVQGRRFEVRAAGSPGRRLAERVVGQSVWVEGRIAPAPPGRRHRLAVRHVVGELKVDRVIDWAPGPPWARSVQRARGLLARGAAPLEAVDRSLFLGVVLGDDREQPRWLVDDFRRAGLGHLTAVSGQNVA